MHKRDSQIIVSLCCEQVKIVKPVRRACVRLDIRTERPSGRAAQCERNAVLLTSGSFLRFSPTKPGVPRQSLAGLTKVRNIIIR